MTYEQFKKATKGYTEEQKQTFLETHAVYTADSRRVYSTRVHGRIYSGLRPVRGIICDSSSLRTNAAIMAAIFQGKDLSPNASDPSQYHDPGHVLPVGNGDEYREKHRDLPVHTIGLRPEALFSPDADASRHYIDGLLSESASRMEDRRKHAATAADAVSADSGSDSVSGGSEG